MTNVKQNPPSAALAAHALTRRFGKSGSHLALNNVSFEIPKGQVVALVGPSGCGKSTLLRCLTWLDQPSSGHVSVGGAWLGRAPDGNGGDLKLSRREIDQLRPKIGMVFQSLNLWPHMTVLENVTRPLLVTQGANAQDAKRNAFDMLAKLSVVELAEKYPGQLSGGQRQRVAIARALALRPEIMLFDEPTSALDPELVGEVLRLLRSFAEDGMTMLVVTHEMGFAREVADRLIVMHAGEIIADDTPEAVISHKADPRVRSFFERVSAFHSSPSQLVSEVST